MADLEEQTAIDLSDEDNDFIKDHNRQFLASDDEENNDLSANIPQRLDEPQLTPEELEAIFHEQIKSQIVQQALALISRDPGTQVVQLEPETPVLLTEIRENMYTDDANSWIVSVACGESCLLDQIIDILNLWQTSIQNEDVKFTDSFEDGFSIVADCVEILRFLTKWFDLPTEDEEDEKKSMDELLVVNYAAIKKHQLIYKKKLLNRFKGSTFSAIVKIIGYIIHKEVKSRVDWDILQYCLEILAQIPAIEPAPFQSKGNRTSTKTKELPSNLPLNLNLSEINTAVCIDVYASNSVLDLIVALSGILKQLNKPFVAECLHDVLYHLTKKVDPASVYHLSSASGRISSDSRSNNRSNTSSSSLSTSGSGLKNFLQKESNLKSQFSQTLNSTRHGRFGTLLQLKTSETTSLTIAGPSRLQSSKTNPIADFEKHKKWRKPHRLTYGADEEVLYVPESLGFASRESLYQFMSDFIKSGVNSLIGQSTRSLISNSDEDYKGSNVKPLALRRRHYFLLIAWILKFFQCSHEGKFNKAPFKAVAATLTDESFVLLYRALDQGFLMKDWGLAHSALLCVMEMIRASKVIMLSDDMSVRLFGESLRDRLFHRKNNLLTLVKFTRDADRRSPKFILTLVELIDLLLPLLEEFSKENMIEVVKRKKTLKLKRILSDEQQAIDAIDIGDVEGLKREANRLSKERRAAFEALEKSLVNAGTISMYVAYLSQYHDLNDSQIKKSIKFLHRLFFKLKKYPTLYRMDFLFLLHRMLSEDGLPRKSSSRNHVQEFLDHFMKKFVKSLQSSSSTLVELLFPDIRDKQMSYFLETGGILAPDQTKIVKVTKIATIKGESDMELERKVAVMVASLIDDDKLELVKWTVKEMEKVYVVRSQQMELDDVNGAASDDPQFNPNLKDIKIETGDVKLQKSLVIEPKIRYLLLLAGFQLPITLDDPCYFSKVKQLSQLTDVMTFISKYLETPVDFDEGHVASDYVQVRLLSNYYNDMNNEGEDAEFGGSYDDDDIEIAFEVAGERRREVGYLDDELDQLEDAIDRGHGRGVRGIARSKNKETEGAHLGKRATGSSKQKNKDSLGKRRTRRAKDGEEHQTEKRSAISDRYVNDSDSDDDADNLFFLREKLLHNFYIENNGSPSKENLDKFMKELEVTLKYAKANRGENEQKGGLFVEQSDDESESDVVDDADDLGVLADDYVVGQPSIETAEKRKDGEGEEPVSSTAKKSIARTLEDSEDDDEQEAPEPVKKKQRFAIVDSDEEDSDDDVDLVVAENQETGASTSVTPPFDDAQEVDTSVSTANHRTLFASGDEDDDGETANTSTAMAKKSQDNIFSDDENEEEKQTVVKKAKGRAIMDDDEYDDE